MERLVFDLVSFGPWLSHVLSRAVFFVIKVVYKGSDKTRLSAKQFFYRKSYSTI